MIAGIAFGALALPRGPVREVRRVESLRAVSPRPVQLNSREYGWPETNFLTRLPFFYLA